MTLARPICFSSSLHICALAALFLASVSAQTRDRNCRNPVETCDPNTNYFPESERIEMKYASTVSNISYSNTFVDIRAYTDATQQLTYRIIKCGCPRPPGSESRVVLFTNPISIYVTESPTLAIVQILDPNLETLSYVPDKTFIYSQEIRENERVKEVLLDNFTKIIGKDPKVSASIIGSFDLIFYPGSSTDIPFIVNPEVLDKSPLGRAETIKIIGLFLGVAKEANLKFENIEREYQEAKDKAREARRRPTVLVDRPFLAVPKVDLSKPVNDLYTWFLPHGNQYISDLLNDANADYLHEKTLADSSLKHSVSQVIEDFKFARFYLNIAHSPVEKDRDTLEEFMNDLLDPENPDRRLRQAMATLSAVRCDNVWHREKRVTQDGSANDVFESAIARPDELLKDYVSILHPSVDFGGRELFYMGQYKAETDEFAKNCPFNDFEGPSPQSKVYVDLQFQVRSKNRFEIDNEWESKIQPELKSIDSDAEYEIWFEAKSGEDEQDVEERTRFFLRAMTVRENASRLNETTEFTEALSRALETEVVQLNPDGSPVPVDRGLSSAGIAVIVIACLAVLLLFVVLVFRLRQRKRSNELEAPIYVQAEA